MDKEQLMNNAKILGFESKFLHNKSYKYSNLEDLRWLFWMTELQKFLRDNYKMFVSIYDYIEGFQSNITWDNYIENDDDDELLYNTYEETLYNGLLIGINDITKWKNQ